MTWPHMAGDDERLQQSGAAEVKPLTHDNLAQLNKLFDGTIDIYGTLRVRCKFSRCASCKFYLLKGPKCVFCKQPLYEGLHYQRPCLNLVSALNEQFPEDRRNALKRKVLMSSPAPMRELRRTSR